MLAFVAAIIPTLGVSFLFWLAIRAMLQADRRERLAMANADRLAERRAAEQAEGEDVPPAV